MRILISMSLVSSALLANASDAASDPCARLQKASGELFACHGQMMTEAAHTWNKDADPQVWKQFCSVYEQELAEAGSDLFKKRRTAILAANPAFDLQTADQWKWFSIMRSPGVCVAAGG